MPTIMYDPNSTPLRYVLAKLGLTTRDVQKATKGKQVYDACGTLLFTGNAGEVWKWLRETGRACPEAE